MLATHHRGMVEKISKSPGVRGTRSAHGMNLKNAAAHFKNGNGTHFEISYFKIAAAAELHSLNVAAADTAQYKTFSAVQPVTKENFLRRSRRNDAFFRSH